MSVKVEHRVHFYETDQMGVVHHANYFRWFELGRVEFLRSIGVTLGALIDDGILFPITEIDAKFHAPARYDDLIEIEVKPVELTKVKLVFDYEIRIAGSDKILVTGHSLNVFTDAATGKIIRIPDKFCDKFLQAQ
ncbi:MAG: acyl-CoA thioesterase [Selenomonadaceae bacterium]|nr:acyl-CoA thioesterase [Selenomonadaceae bacterium]